MRERPYYYNQIFTNQAIEWLFFVMGYFRGQDFLLWMCQAHLLLLLIQFLNRVLA